MSTETYHLEEEKTGDLNQEFQDFRGSDLSKKDLSKIPCEALITSSFDTRTKWPSSEKMPDGFNPDDLLEKSKNPGLGIRELHQEGFDGRGVKVAIIDHKLLANHKEYKDSIADYEEIGKQGDDPEGHGLAVLSLLVGKDCGVAPKAELHYTAVPCGRDFTFWTEALEKILEQNEEKTDNKKIRIVSCSIGFGGGSDDKGVAEWKKALEEAKNAGIIVVHTSMGQTHNFHFVGGGNTESREDPTKLDEWLDFKGKELDLSPNTIMIPCDYRAYASSKGSNDYEYSGKGGLSWSCPYLAGLLALGLQVNPKLTGEELLDKIYSTSKTSKRNGVKVVNPKGFIQAIKDENQTFPEKSLTLP